MSGFIQPRYYEAHIEKNKKVIGFLVLTFYVWYTGPRGYINEIVVSEESQRKGYGKILMDFAENYFKEKGAKEISLMTSPKARAYEFYKNN